MFFKNSTPESAGIPSKAVEKYIGVINAHNISSHSILIARGDKLFCEAYWKPFGREDRHRMYSQTKSFVGLAVRLLADEGKISLDEKIVHYFPDDLPEEIHPFLAAQTVRNMLMMRTCFDDGAVNWFRHHGGDRVKLYFAQKPTVYPGTQYSYDSFGSFILSVLVERKTGMTFLDYLREKCLREIGFSESAVCLTCPGGHSWGDSGLLCTPEDMLLYGRFIGRYGEWNGKQLIRRGILEEAFAEESDLNSCGCVTFSHCGYISQFWKYYGKAVGFNGMHDQCTLYDPETDITFTCTSGNYRSPVGREIIISYLFTEIIAAAKEPLEENAEDFGRLRNKLNALKLIATDGMNASPVENEISGKEFIPDENPMGISRFSLTFEKDRCVFAYRNRQGDKTITLGRRENVFQPFPETGYSAECGGVSAEGHTYRCAASFAWGTENQLNMKIQITDDYIGNLYIAFSYRDSYARVKMDADAEDFLKEYDGILNAWMR